MFNYIIVLQPNNEISLKSLPGLLVEWDELSGQLSILLLYFD